MAEPALIYKMTVLSLLERSDGPLSNTQITEFFQETNYTGFFTAQEIIHDLEDAKLITGEESHNRTLYVITSEGKNTLDLLSDRVTPSIQKDIVDYVTRHKLAIKAENSLKAVYDRAEGGGFIVHLTLEADRHMIMDLNVHVTSREQAEAFCYNWKVHYEDVYGALLDQLVQ